MVEVKQLTCLRCGHRWFPRVQREGTIRRPTYCPKPKCHSPYWNREREMK